MTAAERQVPRPDVARIARDFEELSAIVDTSAAGHTRLAFSSEHRRAKDWLAARMRSAGLQVDEDAASNVIGRRTGTAAGAIATGSHIDTVRGGGRFDGIAGLLAALEVARCLRDADVAMRHELRVVEFTGEEANDHGLSCVGSRTIAGRLTSEDLAQTDPDGTTLAAAIARLGGRPDEIDGASWTDLAAFVELHIEQGPILERDGLAVGLVTGIVGIHRMAVTVTGRPDHAGTTPMDGRRDALCAAAELVLHVEESAGDGGGVATTGRITARPGAANVVCGSADLLIEFRSTDGGWLDGFGARIVDAADRIAARRGVDIDVRPLSATRPVTVDRRVADALHHVVDDLGVASTSMPSGAGHDAAFMADIAPMGMLFVPSRDGRSHCPEEWTDLDDLATGAHVLLGALLRLDDELD